MIDIRATRSPVIPAKAGIQYAAASRFYRWRSGILDRPVKPDDDGLSTCGDLPVGAFDSSCVESFISDFPENSCSLLPKSNLETSPSHPPRAAYPYRHG